MKYFRLDALIKVAAAALAGPSSLAACVRADYAKWRALAKAENIVIE